MKVKSPAIFDKGTLWEKIVKTTANALATSALLPIPTNYEFIEDGDVCFFVRILSNLVRKDEEIKKHEREGGRVNPFLPYEKALYVADISESHVAVLNKFNVVDHHLLIVTRKFEDQETLLTVSDFEALLACMLEYDGLGFYNGGAAAGASQSHKHLQLVPLPLTPEGPGIPIEPLLASAKFKDGLGVVPGFSFLHVFVRLDEAVLTTLHMGAEKIFTLYCRMLIHVGLKAPSTDRGGRQSGSYCLIITRGWMLLVPRSREFFEGISINSLAYAGAMLVRNEQQMAVLKRRGPMKALQHTAI